MAVKRIFRGLMKQGGAPQQGDGAPVAAPSVTSPGASVDPGLRLSLLDSFEETGLGWFWSTDSEGRLTYITQAVLDDAASFLGRPFVTVVETDASSDIGQSARSLGFQLSARSRIADVVVRFAMRRDDPRWWSLSGHPRHNAEGNFEGYAGFARDVTREYTRQREDERAAEFDSLTGLYNRHRMTRRLDSVLSAYRASGRCLISTGSSMSTTPWATLPATNSCGRWPSGFARSSEIAGTSVGWGATSFRSSCLTLRTVVAWGN
jgi:hypothetical protein